MSVTFQSGKCFIALCCFQKSRFYCCRDCDGDSYSVTLCVLQMRTMSDETEQRMCDEDFGSDEEGEEGDVESFMEDNSSELMDRLKELEVS